MMTKTGPGRTEGRSSMIEPKGQGEHESITRRSMLRKAAIAGGTVAWAAPVMQSINMRHAFAQGSPPLVACRMTGGGFVDDAVYGRIRHGFELHCDLSEPNNLEVNWGRGRDSHQFHLAVLTSAACTDDPGIDPDPPPGTGLDTFNGSGSGRLDGDPGATAQWTFTDAGEPGHNDRMRIMILDADGDVVLNVDTTLGGGDHQMHCKD
jgi:hypothetical protein